MLDITTVAVAETATIHLKNAAGEPMYADAERTKPATITVYGPGSKAFAALESRQTARIVKRMNDNDGHRTAATAEERSQETAEDLASITVSFDNFAYPPAAGATGVALFEAFYGDRKLGFLVNQVTKFLADWGNFKPGSAGN